jgi:high-affinity nickel-transport protein
MDNLTIVALGFLLGIRHALDPDHVVAISTIATRAPSFRSSAMIGSLWGMGHTLTLLAVGGSLVVMRSQLSARTALAMEFGVAVMLIALGVITLASASRTDPLPPTTAARPVVVGMVHGMAGSAAIALLVLATVSNTAVGILYLFLFGIGTIAGMIGVTATVVIPATQFMTRVGLSPRAIALAAGTLSVGFGVFMVIVLGGPATLFSAA